MNRNFVLLQIITLLYKQLASFGHWQKQGFVAEQKSSRLVPEWSRVRISPDAGLLKKDNTGRLILKFVFLNWLKT